MDESQRARLLDGLLTQRQAMARAWQRALCRMEPALRDRVAAEHFVPMVERFLTLLLREPGEAQAARALGAEVAALCQGPEALIASQEILARALGDALSAEELAALQPRLTRLFGEMAAGFYGKARGALDATNAFLSMSMELRAPLNSIIGFARVILRGMDGPINELQGKDLSTIEKSGHILLAMLEDLLDLSKIKTQRPMLDPDLFTVEEQVRKLAESISKPSPYRYPSLKSSQTLELNCVDHLGEMEGDAVRVRQLLLSLLRNIIHHTDEGTIRLTVRRERGLKEDAIVFEVRSPEPRAFETYQEYSHRPFSHARISLELELATHLIDLMGGTLTVEGGEEMGSLFTLCLPARMET